MSARASLASDLRTLRWTKPCHGTWPHAVLHIYSASVCMRCVQLCTFYLAAHADTCTEFLARFPKRLVANFPSTGATEHTNWLKMLETASAAAAAAAIRHLIAAVSKKHEATIGYSRAKKKRKMDRHCDLLIFYDATHTSPFMMLRTRVLSRLCPYRGKD